jgi:hypothetical protein
MKKRAIISGGRTLNIYNYPKMIIWLKQILIEYSIGVVLTGDASGADETSADLATKMGIELEHYPAKWKDLEVLPCSVRINKRGEKYNSLAGFIRNEQMANAKPDVCIILPGGNGTADMEKRARKHNILILKYQK